jgi:type II secretory pathway predicted ATPase ExeA
MEYLRYWSLRHPPFAAAPSFFYASTARRTVLAGVDSLVTRRIPLGVIAAPSGCGTTTLLKFLASSCGFGDSAAEVFLSCGRLFRSLRPATVFATLLGLPPAEIRESIVADSLQASAQQGVHTVWLIDDCGESHVHALQEMANSNRCLTIILAGDEKLAATVKSGSKLILKPLGRQETREYIQQSLATAAQDTNLFDEGAIKAIHQYADGRIKRTAELAARALELGCQLRLPAIRASHVAQLMDRRRAA